MKISGSGGKRGNVRRVAVTLTGSDSEIIRTIDELDRLAEETGSSLLVELARQINYRAGTAVDLPCPKDTITI